MFVRHIDHITNSMESVQMQTIIKLSVLILFYTQPSTADIKVNSSGSVFGPHYEYDAERNEWYIPQTNVVVNPLHSLYPNVPEIYHDFVNRTLSRQPTGLCQKEVPATTLIVEGNTTYQHSTARGNGSNPTLSRITVCCQGYQRNAHIVRKCDPICESECINGICFLPNECYCYPDHIKNLGGHCVPTCPIACDNGQCNGNTCICKPGYQLDRTGKLCIPVCNPPCGKGNCTSPNVCSCNRGYESDPTGACIPKCTHGCDYGHCVAPEKCECGDGYLFQNAQCTPVCPKGCVNGACTAPNKCSCREGWTIDKTGIRCDAKCDRPCLNGQCNHPNQCDCNPGYRIDPTDPFKCNAHCPEPCVNGVCSSPGLCICNVGFVKDRPVKGSHICIPRA